MFATRTIPALVAVAPMATIIGAVADARADGHGAATITSDGSIDTTRLRALLDVELAMIESSGRPTHVGVTRAGKGWNVRVEFRDGTEVRNLAATKAEPDATVRILALVVAEVVRNHRTSGPEPAPHLERPTASEADATRSPPEGPSTKETTATATANENPKASSRAMATAEKATATATATSATPETNSRKDHGANMTFGVEATFGLRVFAPMGTVALEPRLSVRAELASGWGAELNAFYIRSGATDPLGKATLDGFGGGASLSYGLVSSRAVRLRVGPRLDVAVLQGTGDASSEESIGKTATSPFVATAGEIVLRTRLVGRTWFVFGADTGYVLHGFDLRADDRRLVAAKGWFVGGRLGLGFE